MCDPQPARDGYRNRPHFPKAARWRGGRTTNIQWYYPVKKTAITVSVVEDHGPTREGLSQLINRTEEFECVSEHPNGEDAVARVPHYKPSVVLMDINLPGITGVDAVSRLKPCLPQTQFIMLT